MTPWVYSPVTLTTRVRPSSPSEYDSDDLEAFPPSESSRPSEPRTPRIDDRPLPEPRTPPLQLEDLDLSPDTPPFDLDRSPPLPPPAQVEILENSDAESSEPIEIEPARQSLQHSAPTRTAPAVPRLPAPTPKSSLLPSLLDASKAFKKYQEEANRRLAAQRKVQQASIPVSKTIQRTVHHRQTKKLRQNKKHISFTCELCNVACPNRGQLEDHKKSKKHKRASLPDSFTCQICKLTVHSPEDFRRHNTSRKHRQRAQYH